MPPLNQLDMEVLVKSPVHGRNTCCWEEGSVSSEVSLDLFDKDEVESGSNTASSGAGWDLDGSDYSLNVLLPTNGDNVDSDSALDSAKMSSLDFSLNLNLPRTRLSKNTTKTETLSEETDDSSACSCSSDPVDGDQSMGTSTTSTKSDRKVHFYPRVRIQRITNRQNLSEEYIEAVWYSRDEFKTIRKECFKTIRLLTDGECIDEEEGELCARGLEYKVPSLYKERQRNKSAIRHAIFEEQENQWGNDIEDPLSLAKISREISATCVEDAIVRGLLDEHAVEDYLQKEN